MTNPIDTIRHVKFVGTREECAAALAALTQVEQQLAEAVALRSLNMDWHEAHVRAVAAETALAEAKRENEEWNALYGRLDMQRRQDVEAAEQRANDLADALRDFEAAVRVYDVMLNEPAAEGLMSAEDYSAYLRGAWLGVEEAAVVARAALDRQEQP